MTEGTYYISRVWSVEAGKDLDVGYCVVPLTPELRQVVQIMRKHYGILREESGREICSIELDFRVLFWLRDLPITLDDFEQDLNDWEPIPGQSPVELLAETQPGKIAEIPFMLSTLQEKTKGGSICMYSLSTFFLRCRQNDGKEGDTAIFSREMMDWLSGEGDE